MRLKIAANLDENRSIKMHMSKKQLLVFIAIVMLALGAYFAALWLVRDSELAMIGFVLLFGALFVTTIIIGAWDHLNVKPRHATLR